MTRRRLPHRRQPRRLAASRIALAPVAAARGTDALVLPPLGGVADRGPPALPPCLYPLRAGPRAAERTVAEFFTAQIRNPAWCCHTRAAYAAAVTRRSSPGATHAGSTRSPAASPIAAHESPRTTKLYDRTADEVTIEDIEKIGI